MAITPAVARNPHEQILVVDEDPKIVNLVRAYLVAAGFDVMTAEDGLSALEKIRAHRPQLIVLDPSRGIRSASRASKPHFRPEWRKPRHPSVTHSVAYSKSHSPLSRAANWM